MGTRFAVQRHETPRPEDAHFDLLIERRGVLVTFRVADLDALGALTPGDAPLEVVRIPDHRVKYLDYEGPISGDRGSVTLRDRGPSELLEEDASEDARLRVHLEGDHVRGTFRLERVGPGDAEGETRWTIARQPTRR